MFACSLSGISIRLPEGSHVYEKVARNKNDVPLHEQRHASEVQPYHSLVGDVDGSHR
jgi:hypothetical protein